MSVLLYPWKLSTAQLTET